MCDTVLITGKLWLVCSQYLGCQRYSYRYQLMQPDTTTARGLNLVDQQQKDAEFGLLIFHLICAKKIKYGELLKENKSKFVYSKANTVYTTETYHTCSYCPVLKNKTKKKPAPNDLFTKQKQGNFVWRRNVCHSR